MGLKKKLIWIVIIGLAAITPLQALDKQELMDTLSTLDYNDYKAIEEAKKKQLYEFATKHGYVDIVPVGGGGGVMAFFLGNGANKGNDTQSGDIDVAFGGSGGFVVNITKKWGIGGWFGGFGGQASEEINGTFHDYKTGGAFQQLLVKRRLVVDPKWMVDLDLGLGFLQAGYENKITTETTTTLDSYRTGVGLSGLVGLDIRYRFTPLFNLSLKTGYFYGRIDNPKRGGAQAGSEDLDLSSPYLMIGFSGNY